MPSAGSRAPSLSRLELPSADHKPTFITFLRHCGCPFAEKTFLNFRESAKNNKDINFIAISHSSDAATQSWLKSLPQSGSEPSNLRIVVDEDREIYAAWGLGISGWAHTLSPWSMYSVWRLGKNEGIWNRPTESGSRWQMAGSFAVDGGGAVRWGAAANRADDVPDFGAAVGALKGGSERAKL